jgi:membrane fusion protein (multidrug efflux system)
MKKIIIAIIVIAIAFLAAKYLMAQKKEVLELATPKTYKHSIKTTRAKRDTLSQTRDFLAQLLASKNAIIASKFSAEIKKIYVKENSIVKKGELLVALDDREIRANIATLQKQKKTLDIDVANAKRSLERNKKLLDIEAISQEKYDDSNLAYQSKVTNLQATLQKIKQAKAQLTYLLIKAPFSGRVGTIYLDAGNLASPSKPIISLNSDDQKLIFSYAATSDLINQGQKVLVDAKEIGEITKTYDDAKNALLVAEVKPSVALAFANKSFINISVVTATQEGCTIPLNAILNKKDKKSIMLYKDGKFQAQKINVLLQNTQKALIESCPKEKIAIASEAKLSLLPALGSVNIIEEN